MTRRRRAAALLALASIAALLVGAPACAKPPVWIARSKHATLVLFGSIHLLPPGLDWRPKVLDEALGKANEVWFELPITTDSDRRAAATSAMRGELPKGRSLLQMLSPGAAAQLQAAAQSLHYPPEIIESMQPWMADLTLSIVDDGRNGATAFNGVETQVQAITPAATRRRALETPEQQIGFLAGAPLADQLASLRWTVGEIDSDPGSYRRLISEWMAGDVAGLERDAIAPLQEVSPTLYERLLVNRNRAWARKIERRMRRPGLVVVVVGVGHMLGPAGLPALLRAHGLAVEGP